MATVPFARSSRLPYAGGMALQKLEPAREAGEGQDRVSLAYAGARKRLGRLGVSLERFRERAAESLQELAALEGKSGGSLAFEDLYLAMGCQQGNERAWRIFERSFRGYLRRLCIRATGSETEGEELLGDLYADLVDRPCAPGKMERYRGMASLGTWLAVIVRRMALDRARSGDRRSQRERDFEQALLQAEPSTPEGRLLQAEAASVGGEILREALASLEPRHRLVLALVYWDGLTLREAGQVLGIDFSTVSRRLKSAREAVGKAIRQVSRQRYGLPPEALAGLMEHVVGPLEAAASTQEGER